MSSVVSGNQVGFVSTLHDPAGVMQPFLSPCLPVITALYRSLFVIATPESSPDTLETLCKAGVQVLPEGTKSIGENRRKALALGLAEEQNTHFHYCDFDRLLHWALHFPAELQHMVTHVVPSAGYQAAGYLAIGRTSTAFATHPPVQQQLESLTNRVFSHVFGTEMDVTAGSCALSRPVAEFLLAYSTEPTNATDTEWPMLVRYHMSDTVEFYPVDGLAYETATFFGKEAYAQSDDPQNWQRRTQLARDSIEAVLRLDITH